MILSLTLVLPHEDVGRLSALCLYGALVITKAVNCKAQEINTRISAVALSVQMVHRCLPIFSMTQMKLTFFLHYNPVHLPFVGDGEVAGKLRFCGVSENELCGKKLG